MRDHLEDWRWRVSISFALIGAGGIAQSYVQAFENNPHAKLIAVCDSRPEAAKAMAERMNCKAVAEVKQLCDPGLRIEAVVVCTPPITHEEIVVELLRSGKHVLCEKPFTLSQASAERMIAEAKTAGKLLTMASKFRYVDDMIRLKSIILSGVLGNVVMVENAFTARVDMAERWNARPEISGGGVLIDNGTHSVDVVRYLLGPIKEVRALQFPNIQPLPVEDTVQLYVKSEKGIQATVDLSWSINKELDWFVKVFGTQGTAVVGWKESKYRQHSARDWVKIGDGYNKVQAFRDELTNFARSCTGQESLLITAEDALANVKVIEAAYKSLREPVWTSVN